MGSFFGHVLPGSFFILIAVWWMVHIFCRFYKSLHKGSVDNNKNHGGFYGTVTFPLRIRRRWIDIEAYSIIIGCAIGLLVELVGATIKNHHLGTGNLQHGTMYLFFGLTGLSAVLLPRLKVIPRCDEVVYLLLFLSYLVEGLLFKFHLFGRDDIDVVLHTLLVYTIWGCAAVTLLEVRHRDSIWPPLARAFFTCLQGTWFWQTACMLYPPQTNPWGALPREPEEGGHVHNTIMFITCVYAWHMAGICVFMAICSVSIGCFYRRKGLVDEEALMDRHYALRAESMGYSSLQQNSLEQDDEL